MGTLRAGPNAAFVVDLRDVLELRVFVETGTYRGETTAFAAGAFDRVVTVEVRDDYRADAMDRLAGHGNIEFVAGDSAIVLPQVVAGLEGPAMFWLDGHAGGGHFGTEDRCPVLAELAAINTSPHEHVILVDDARAFLAPPPPPFDPAVWPSITEVLDAARARHSYYCVVIDDIIVCAPPAARPTVMEFCARARPKI